MTAISGELHSPEMFFFNPQSASCQKTATGVASYYPRILFHHEPPLPICTWVISVSVEDLSVSTAPAISSEGRQSAAPYLIIVRASFSDGQFRTITRVPSATQARTTAGMSLIEPERET